MILFLILSFIAGIVIGAGFAAYFIDKNHTKYIGWQIKNIDLEAKKSWSEANKFNPHFEPTDHMVAFNFADTEACTNLREFLDGFGERMKTLERQPMTDEQRAKAKQLIKDYKEAERKFYEETRKDK